jgi:hypothetical protein
VRIFKDTDYTLDLVDEGQFVFKKLWNSDADGTVLGNVKGILDRISGELYVAWYREKDPGGLTQTNAAELFGTCSAAKPKF